MAGSQSAMNTNSYVNISSLPQLQQPLHPCHRHRHTSQIHTNTNTATDRNHEGRYEGIIGQASPRPCRQRQRK